MEFKYFHGTSTIFLDSIKANGLGKINPNIDFRNLDVLKYLTNIAENNIRNNSEYLILRDTCLAMVNQTALRVNHENGNSTLLNYRHDGIYVAISLQRAVIYSAFNKFGSEILERCVVLYKLLEKLGIMFQIPENLNLFGIEKYLDCHPSPIIVEITKIDDENLESEHGRKAKEALDFLRVTIPKMTDKEKFERLQFCNFKIVNFVEPKYLKFYKLEFEGHPAKGNFEFTLSKL